MITPSSSAGAATTRASSTNVGAIAGGAAGGAAALIILALLLWFCIRKRKRDDFDGDFDPDRVDAALPDRDPTLPRLDMEVTPYSYDVHDGAGGAGVVDQRPMYDMAERSDGSGGYLLAGAVRSQTPPFSDIHGNHSSTSGSHYTPTSSGHGLLGNTATGYGHLPTVKEREASMDRRRLYVANEGYGQGSGDVIQHRDGGRVLADEPQREIPPSYDSIGPDH